MEDIHAARSAAETQTTPTRADHVGSASVGLGVFVPYVGAELLRMILAMARNASIPETAVLPPEECWRLLQGDSVGRLAVWVNDHPEIFPINSKVHHESLVSWTGAGTSLHPLSAGR